MKSRLLPVLLIAVALRCAVAQESTDFRSRVGLGPMREGEIRIWWLGASRPGGIDLTDTELIEFSTGRRLDSSPREIHDGIWWYRSKPDGRFLQRSRAALAGLKALNGRHLSCGEVLDATTVIIEARLDGGNLDISAEEPAECGDGDGRAIAAFADLMMKYRPSER